MNIKKVPMQTIQYHHNDCFFSKRAFFLPKHYIAVLASHQQLFLEGCSFFFFFSADSTGL